MSDTLGKLSTEIRQCRICVENPLGAALPHGPRPVFRVSETATICVCGQAPGTRVHASGTPFTDPSGDRLRDWMGVTSDEFYDVSRVAIVPMGFCFPGLNDSGGDLPPRKECAQHWHEKIFAQLGNLRLVLLVGHYAQKWHLKHRAGTTLTSTVRAWRDHLSHGGDRIYFPLPHPSWRNNAWLKKNIWFEKEVLPELKENVRTFL